MHEQDFSKTERLYYKDSELRCFNARVLSCKWNSSEDDYEVVLDKTAFFPTGGGQEGDTGTMWDNTPRPASSAALRRPAYAAAMVCSMPTASDGPSSINVLNTTERDGLIIHHTDEPIAAGKSVQCAIDWGQRFDRMQQHSAEHIISGLVNKYCHLDNVGFALYDDKTTLDFNGVLTQNKLRYIEKKANEAVAAAINIETSFPTKEEERFINYRSKLDIEGQVRLVNIPGYDICACCAPHVKNTAQIGLIKIIDAVNHRGGMRLTLLAGERALDDYEARLSLSKNIGAALSVPFSGIEERLENLKQELQNLNYEINSWQRKYIDALQAETFSAGQFIIIEEKVASDIVRQYINDSLDSLARMGVKPLSAGEAADPGEAPVIAAFYKNTDGGYNYIIASKAADVRPLGKRLNESLNGRGGGKPAMIQGQVAATSDDIRSFLLAI